MRLRFASTEALCFRCLRLPSSSNRRQDGHRIALMPLLALGSAKHGNHAGRITGWSGRQPIRPWLSWLRQTHHCFGARTNRFPAVSTRILRTATANGARADLVENSAPLHFVANTSCFLSRKLAATNDFCLWQSTCSMYRRTKQPKAASFRVERLADRY